MLEIVLQTAQFQFGTGAVALLLEHDFGSVFATTTEAALRARMTVQGENWGNDEALAEAQAWVDADPKLGGKGYVVVMPAPLTPLTPLTAVEAPPVPALPPAPAGPEGGPDASS